MSLAYLQLELLSYEKNSRQSNLYQEVIIYSFLRLFNNLHNAYQLTEKINENGLNYIFTRESYLNITYVNEHVHS